MTFSLAEFFPATMLNPDQNKIPPKVTVDVFNRIVFQYPSTMTWLLHCKIYQFCGLTALVGLGSMGWCARAEAAPQLRYRTLQAGGTLQTCLSRSATSMTGAGFTNPATTATEVIGDNGQITVTVACQALTPQQFQATVMVAAAETIAPARVNTTLNTITGGLASGSDDGDLPGSPTGQRAMDNEAFNQFMAALEDSWPNYLEFLQQPVSKNYFTANQASQIVETMRFADDEVDAAVMLYPRVVDPGNWYVVEQAISFESSRRELRRRLADD